MYCIKKITDDMYWVGGNDRRLSLFENAFPIPRGISYNSYVVLDEKTVLMDTVDAAIGEQFMENVEHVLDGRALDYLIVNHMEPDHCATILQIVKAYPEVKLVGNVKTINMMKQFFDFNVDEKVVSVKEGDTLETGRHTFTFVMSPMVHWPEVMVTYDVTDQILYSADAFGTFGAINGNLFADELKFETEWLTDARSYYANIVGKYGVQVQALLKKASALEIKMICPLHGPIWRDNIEWYANKYDQWSRYEAEEQSVVIVYASIYGHTENAANILACKLGDMGVKNIKMYDVSETHPSDLIAEAWRASHMVFASVTYNSGIFPSMETLLHDLKAHNWQNRTVAIMENGSWGITVGKQMRDILDGLKELTFIEDKVSIKSSVKTEQIEEIEKLAQAIFDTMS